MSQITSDILAKIAPGTPRKLRDRFIPYYNECLPRYEITTRDRVAAYLTTVCFESDYFKALSEYASGWDYDISRNPKKARELGNTAVGDGPRYKGAGGIETTGKKNFKRLSDRLGIDFVANPGLLRTEKYFVEAACVFWDDNNFNDLADDDQITRIENITNRGSGNKTAKALADRIKIYHNVMAILPDDFDLNSATVTETDGDIIPPAVEEPSQESAINPSGAANQLPNNSDMLQPTDQQPGIIDALSSKADALGEWQAKLAKLNPENYLPTMPTGIWTKVLVWVKVVWGIAMAAWGMIMTHPDAVIAGLVLLIVAAAIWIDSRHRNNPKGAVPVSMIGAAITAQTDTPAPATGSAGS